jgi:hypothetical protein
MTTTTDTQPNAPVAGEDQRVKHPEDWRFAGVRVGTAGKKVHAWDDQRGGGLLLYPAKGHYSLGAVYTVHVEREDDGITLYRGGEAAPRFARAERDGKTEQWAVEERAAEAQLARKARERKADSADALARLYDVLGPLADQTRTTAQRDALMAYCAQVIYGSRR